MTTNIDNTATTARTLRNLAVSTAKLVKKDLTTENQAAGVFDISEYFNAIPGMNGVIISELAEVIKNVQLIVINIEELANASDAVAKITELQGELKKKDQEISQLKQSNTTLTAVVQDQLTKTFQLSEIMRSAADRAANDVTQIINTSSGVINSLGNSLNKTSQIMGTQPNDYPRESNFLSQFTTTNTQIVTGSAQYNKPTNYTQADGIMSATPIFVGTTNGSNSRTNPTTTTNTTNSQINTNTSTFGNGISYTNATIESAEVRMSEMIIGNTTTANIRPKQTTTSQMNQFSNTRAQIESIAIPQNYPVPKALVKNEELVNSMHNTNSTNNKKL
jgi:vacuolar-type H+-ATPase subunit I/STV1